MDRKFVEEMHGIGLHEGRIGGEPRLNTVAAYFNAQVTTPVVAPIEEAKEAPTAPETPAADAAPEATEIPEATAPEADEAKVDESVDEEEAIWEALYEGPALTEELLEYLESTDWDEANEEELDAVVELLLDKEVSEDLEERTREFLAIIQEKKAFRIVKGKKKRVNVKVGGEKAQAKREYRKYMRTKGHRAKAKRQKKLRSRKSIAKLAAKRTARYHKTHKSLKGTFTGIVKKAASKLANVAKKVKEKAGLAPKAGKMESELMTSLRNLLTEEAAWEPTERDAIMVTMGNVAESLEMIFEYLDPSVAEFMGEQYVVLAEEYLDGSLQEGTIDDGDFIKRVGAYAKLVGQCISDLEKKSEDRA